MATEYYSDVELFSRQSRFVRAKAKSGNPVKKFTHEKSFDIHEWGVNFFTFIVLEIACSTKAKLFLFLLKIAFG